MGWAATPGAPSQRWIDPVNQRPPVLCRRRDADTNPSDVIGLQLPVTDRRQLIVAVEAIELLPRNQGPGKPARHPG